MVRFMDLFTSKQTVRTTMFGNRKTGTPITSLLPPEMISLIFYFVSGDDRMGKTMQSLLRVSKTFRLLAEPYRYWNVSIVGLERIENFVQSTQSMNIIPIHTLFISDRPAEEAHEAFGFPERNAPAHNSRSTTYANAASDSKAQHLRFVTAMRLLLARAHYSMDAFACLIYNPHQGLPTFITAFAFPTLHSLILRMPRLPLDILLPSTLRRVHISITRKIYRSELRAIALTCRRCASLEQLVISGIGVQDLSSDTSEAVVHELHTTLHPVTIQPFTSRRNNSSRALARLLARAPTPVPVENGLTSFSAITTITVPEWQNLFHSQAMVCSFGARMQHHKLSASDSHV